MSQNTTEPTAAESIVEGEVVGNTEAQSVWSKMNPVPHIKKHPKIATAIGLGVALVVGAAFLGDDEHDGNGNPLDEPSPESMDEARQALEEFGIPVTDES